MGADLRPRQSLDLVDEPPLRRRAAVLHRPASQLSGGGDPARIRHPVRAVVSDHARVVHVPHVRRAHLHGPRPGFRALVPGIQAAPSEPGGTGRGASRDGGLLLRLLLSGLDRGTDLELSLVRRLRHTALGAEDVACQLPRLARVAAADLLLELIARLFLAPRAGAGFRIPYLSRVAFTLRARIAVCAALGAMTVALSTFLPALAISDLTLMTPF